jgi:hypothetical protein
MKSDKKIPETLTKIAKPERPATLNLVSTIELRGCMKKHRVEWENGEG